jgi:hypothetical protein
MDFQFTNKLGQQSGNDVLDRMKFESSLINVLSSTIELFENELDNIRNMAVKYTEIRSNGWEQYIAVIGDHYQTQLRSLEYKVQLVTSLALLFI